MVTREAAWVSHGKLPIKFSTPQVFGLRHDLPLRILTSHLLPDAFPLEEKSKFVMFSICTVLNKGHGASLGYLALITIGGTVFVFGLNPTDLIRCYRMSASVKRHGLTTLDSISPPGIASNHIW